MSNFTLKENATLQGGKFTILKVLGQGGFGITYLAEQPLLQKQVAIKEFFLHDLCARDATGAVTTLTQGDMVYRYREKFIKEARMLARLNHPGIVHVTDIFEENGTFYYVMEYVEGESLSAKVKRSGRLSEPAALRYISGVAAALAYIHKERVNHLDLKPSNIMVRRSDDAPILIDFGVSKQYDEQKNQTTSTPPGVSNGYSPLEQYKPGGVSTFSPQSDIYSLGATLYNLLTGMTPPNAGDVLNDGLPPIPSSVSPQVRAAIAMAMQPRCKDRPESVDVLMEMMGVKASTDAPETEDMQPVVVNVETAEGESTLPADTEEAQAGLVKMKRSSWLKKTFAALLAAGVVMFLGSKLFGGATSTSSTSLCPDGNHPHMIDLGLPSGTKWACCNVGADAPEAYGNYYAWGETETKGTYNWKTYIHCDGSEETCHDLGSDIAGTKYDVAHVKWGGSWVMPSLDQIEELLDNCEHTWTTVNGGEGLKFTGKNGRSIFLPAAGYRWDDDLDKGVGFGNYWSSTLDPSDSYYAYYLPFVSVDAFWLSHSRGIGLTVRPVSK